MFEYQMTFMEACEAKRDVEDDAPGHRWDRHLTMSETDRVTQEHRDAMFDAMYGSEVGYE